MSRNNTVAAVDWNVWPRAEREAWRARYTGKMPVGTKIRWFIAGFLESQIQTMITERILAYDRVNSSVAPTEQSNPAPPPNWRADQVEADRI